MLSLPVRWRGEWVDQFDAILRTSSSPHGTELPTDRYANSRTRQQKEEMIHDPGYPSLDMRRS